MRCAGAIILATLIGFYFGMVWVHHIHNSLAEKNEYMRMGAVGMCVSLGKPQALCVEMAKPFKLEEK